MHRRRFTRTLAVASLVTALTVTAGCSGGSADAGASSSGQALEKVTYLTSFGTFGRDAYAYVAKEKGYFRDAGFDGFRFSPPQMLRAVVLIGLILVVTGTLANLLLAKLFNVLSDTVGGIRITLAEDVAPQRQR